MDPLSIFTSSLAVLGAANSVGKGIRKLIDLRKAPAEVAELIDDVERLKAVLKSTTGIDRANEIQPQLYKLEKILLELDKAIEYRIKSHQDPYREEYKISKHVYALEKKNIRASKQEISSLLIEISLILNAQNMAMWQVAVPLLRQFEPLVHGMMEKISHDSSQHMEQLRLDVGRACNQYQAQLVTKPALLKESIMAIENPEEIVKTVSQPFVAYDFQRHSCTCHRPWSNRIVSVSRYSNTTITNTRLWQHQQNCPFYMVEQAKKTFCIKLQWLSKLVSTAAEFSLSFKFGSHPFAIAPNLVLRGVARKDSPALLEPLFRKHGWFDRRGEYPLMMKFNPSLDILPKVADDLKEAFLSGLAKPTEVDENGRDLFWQLDNLLFCNVSAPVFYPETAYIKDLSSFLNNLRLFGLSMAGTIPGRNLTSRTCFLERVLHFSEFLEPDYYVKECVRNLLDVDAYDSCKIPLSIRGKSFAILAREIDGLSELYDLNPIVRAIILEDIPQIGKLAVKQPALIIEPGIDGSTALDWSASCPEILNILLKSIPDEASEAMASALVRACYVNCFQSVEKLLQRGAPVDARLFEIVVMRACELSIFQIVATALAAHRRQLRDVALAQLPKHVLVRFRNLHLGLPDQDAQSMAQCLLSHGIRLQPLLSSTETYFHSVYQFLGLDEERAEILYSLGFDDINIIRSTGGDTLGRLESWLIRKGLDLDLRIPYSEDKSGEHCSASSFTTVAHYLGFLGGDWSFSTREVVSALFSKTLRYPRDSCDCICSPNGCTITSLFCKRFRGRGFGRIPEEIRTLVITADLISLLFGPTFIRQWLFDELKLTHTCCGRSDRPWHSMHAPLNADDAKEIQEEENDIIQLLEVLTEKACVEFRTSTEPIHEFLERFCEEEIPSTINGNLTEDNLCKLRELGVSLE